ncbi:RNB domain-containing ribonuclease [Glaciihabitans arcticus]|uniref:RNB domain-containing ribonuclease n=1 Tax=Glaciihabitans arcticus TaxID=2668039 RepID=A0A4Q9GVZ6_9MICO|nr:RNB domain-containing ribonuclease [Glaciihabitans arcticus]TBN56370.1 RNB domain-containing ribonuclease [Glaciihabitans arcticus]
MPTPSLRLARAATGELAAALAAIPIELGLPRDFPAEVLAAVPSPALPELDLTHLEFVTVDPQGATDLDQAFLLERAGDGYRVYYAIANLAAFVQPGGPIDVEARRRGQTIYAPDGRIPLHPPEISEDAASLLAGVDRGAYVWDFELDTAASVTSFSVRLATIRSRMQLTYETVDIPLLGEIGEKRIALERARGGASLTLPETEIVESNGTYTLVRRRPLRAEAWNAQLSLLTGMAAAELMLGAGVGILRTMPPAPAEAVDEFRLRARALGHPWREDMPYGDFLRSLDLNDPAQLAIMHAAASLFRGAGYTVFDGSAPGVTTQAAVAAPYAHATAPLRRLVDRFVLAACEAISAGRPVPEWVRGALPSLPSLMSASGALAGQVDRLAIDTVEAALLAPSIGAIFDATVISARATSGTIQLLSPAVSASCDGALVAGSRISARLDIADVATATVRFTAIQDAAAPGSP